MAWEEWEQLKAAAARRHSEGMQIDQLDAPSGGGAGTSGSPWPHGSSGATSPDLRASKGPWTKASGVALELRSETDSGLTDLRTAHDGVKGGTDGFASTAALDEILPTWEKRLASVRDECHRLTGAFAKTGHVFGEVDPAVAGEVNKVRVGDTPDWAR